VVSTHCVYTNISINTNIISSFNLVYQHHRYSVKSESSSCDTIPEDTGGGAMYGAIMQRESTGCVGTVT
jgi:hypothetical protein